MIEYLDYTVDEMLEDLNGHPKDRIIKVQLEDGTVKDIEGISFVNIIVGGDDIIYIKTRNEMWDKHHKEVKATIENGYNVAEALRSAIYNDDIKDNDWALEAIALVANEIDFWLNKLKIKHNMENGTGPDFEIFDKIKLLDEWVHSH